MHVVGRQNLLITRSKSQKNIVMVTTNPTTTQNVQNSITANLCQSVWIENK